jgi:hypothetical protein
VTVVEIVILVSSDSFQILEHGQFWCCIRPILGEIGAAAVYQYRTHKKGRKKRDDLIAFFYYLY